MDSPFTLTLYDKAFVRTGWVNDADAITCTPRHNQIGTTSVTVPSSHRMLPRLTEPGARMVVGYRGEQIMSGYITGRSGQGPTSAGTITVTMQDDLWLMWRALGWPVPAQTDPFGTQGTKQDTRTGAAETVAKAFVTANKAHLVDGPLITVATTAGRGSSITVSSRMKVLADQLMDAVDKAGIGLSAKQVGAGVTLDAYTPSVYPHTLSEAAGTVISWEWSDSDPTLTRAIVGGPGVDTSREFRRRINTAAETELGYSIEGLVDAQSVENYTQHDAAGDEALTAADRKSGFKLGLSETAAFKYGGNGVHVGDQVTVNIGGNTYTDVLREATLQFDRDNGLVVSPTVGERSDDPDVKLARFLSNIARGIRDLRAR